MEVDSDCTKVALGQHVMVTIETVPSYCGIAWRGSYEAPGMDLGRLFPAYLVTGNTNLSFFFLFKLKTVPLLSGCVRDDVKKHVPECISKFSQDSGTFC